MKKGLIVLVALLLASFLAGSLYAQEAKYVSGGTARELSLGGSPNNPYLMDYTDVLVNPAYAAKYGNVLLGELGYTFAGYTATGQGLTYILGVNNNLAVGLSIGSQEGPVFAANSYGGSVGGLFTASDNMVAGMNGVPGVPAGTFAPPATWAPVQLFASFKMSGMTLGAGLYRVGWSNTQDNIGQSKTKNEVSLGQTGLKLGGLFDMNGTMVDGSALLRINSASAKTTPTGTPSSEVSASGLELGVNLRAFYKMNDKMTFVPQARFYTFSYQPEITATPAPVPPKPNDYGRTEWEVGAGMNIAVPSGKIYAGLAVESISLTDNVTAAAGGGTTTTNNTATSFDLPKFNIGGEFDLASWLTARIGYFKAFSAVTTTMEPPSPATQEQTTISLDRMYLPAYATASTAAEQMSLGMGVHFDRFNIDGYLAEAWLANGPYIVSGVGQAMFGVLSLTYNLN